MQRYRKELKFVCTRMELINIENSIKTIMKKDIHQDGESYNIRSIYFDSPSDECFYENSAGVGSRNKYRIRIYGKSKSLIKAEIKSKYRETISKFSENLTMEEYYSIISRSNLGILADKGDVHNQYLNMIMAEGYRPTSIVEYERKAYTYDPCNVRITFDTNLAASTKYNLFFDRSLEAIPLLEGGQHVLEVKYDEFLPEFIQELLAGEHLERTSNSKYYLSRQILGRMYR